MSLRMQNLESNFRDAEVNTKDVPEDMHEDDPQDKVAANDVGENSKPDESNPVMTRMEIVMTVLTKLSPDVQAPQTNDALEKADPKDPRSSSICKDKGKAIAVEELRKTPSTKYPTKSKAADQPQQKRKENNALGHDDKTNSRGRVMQKNKIDVTIRTLETRRESPHPMIPVTTMRMMTNYIQTTTKRTIPND
uniref:Uncharacterized protein n=1 Tax=Cannabis sativa TaxID=3483 RepID=A0A803Q7P5_CANSA